MIAGLLIVFVLMSACATQNIESTEKAPGFLKGVLHGFIILFSLISSIFTDYRIYAFPNNGGWYDFGFFVGVMMFFGGGGGAAGRKSKKWKDED